MKCPNCDEPEMLSYEEGDEVVFICPECRYTERGQLA